MKKRERWNEKEVRSSGVFIRNEDELSLRYKTVAHSLNTKSEAGPTKALNLQSQTHTNFKTAINMEWRGNGTRVSC